MIVIDLFTVRFPDLPLNVSSVVVLVGPETLKQEDYPDRSLLIHRLFCRVPRRRAYVLEGFLAAHPSETVKIYTRDDDLREYFEPKKAEEESKDSKNSEDSEPCEHSVHPALLEMLVKFGAGAMKNPDTKKEIEGFMAHLQQAQNEEKAK